MSDHVTRLTVSYEDQSKTKHPHVGITVTDNQRDANGEATSYACHCWYNVDSLDQSQ